MRTSLGSFWRRNLAFFRVGIITNLEYRVNFITDALVQPVLTTLIELTLWLAVFHSQASETIGGFTRAHYFAYAMWAAFMGRITANWMYEFRMIEEIESGSVNSVLSRPITYFEYYWSQFSGYKFVTTAVSFCIPLAVELWLDSPSILSRLPLAIALVFYFLFFVYTMSFCVVGLAFFFNRVYSITMAKNLFLWLLVGELFPLDLLPEPWKSWLISAPFAAGVYIPAGYVTGRFGPELVLQGFASVTLGIIVAGAIAAMIWKAGVRHYTGTGA
ncbi:MAG TPA: ABC-2 family transporter protein [Bdellovibrionales bacterium]|nr:ABC-2 family transporter protein [Bdellovibrionales bacterium]